MGGGIEDPATGAAAAVLGGYLRDAKLEQAPFNFEIHQGESMGRPSQLFVHAPIKGDIQVSGTAIEITDKT